MKTSRVGRASVATLIVVLLLVVLSAMAFTACGKQSSITAIEIDESTNDGVYQVATFASTDYAKIMLKVTYESGEVNSIGLQKSMLTTEDKAKLSQEGTQTLTVNYQGKTATLTVRLVGENVDVVTVTFKDGTSQNATIAVQKAVSGESVKEITAPAVEGKVFSAWVDADGNPVDLATVTASITVHPSYTSEKATYTYRFVDCNGTALTSGQLDKGEKIAKTPTINLSQYPRVASYTWSENLETFTIQSDVTIRMIATYKQGYVRFVYALDSDLDRVYEMDQYNVAVDLSKEDDENTRTVNAKKTAAERELAQKGYSIKTYPQQSTPITLTENGQQITFKYVVEDASVTVNLYNDADKKTLLSTESKKVNDVVSLPAEAATVRGSYLVGWKIEGSEGSETIRLTTADRWTVSGRYGSAVSLTPVYEEITVPVTFHFVFGDKELDRESGTYYTLTLKKSGEFAISEIITYSYIDNLLQNIINNKQTYLDAFVRKIENVEVSDNSSASREDAFGIIDGCHIASVSYGTENTENMAPGGSKVVATSNDELTVRLSQTTVGMVFAEIKDKEDATKTIGYKVVGLDQKYVEGTNVYIPATYKAESSKTAYPVLEIGESAFVGKNILFVASSIKTIGANAFKNATIYSELNLPDVEKIGASAFSGATLVAENATFGKVASLGISAFEGVQADGLTVRIGGTALTEVDDSCFKDAEGIVEIVLPGTVKTIGANAFAGTGVLAIGDLRAVETVGANAFDGVATEEIVLPKAKTIGAEAFANNKALVRLVLGSEGAAGDNLTFDFGMLNKSTEVTSITFGAGLKTVNKDNTVLGALSRLSAITVNGENASYFTDGGVLYALGDNASLLYYPNDKSGSYALATKASKNVVVNTDAFANATVAVLDLTKVSIASFNGQTENVYAVKVKEADKTGAEAAFKGANVFKEGEDILYGYDEDYDLVYEIVKTGTGEAAKSTVTVRGGYKRATEITVPASINNIPVTKIGDNAFENFKDLTSLTVLATVDSWNASILNGADALKTLDIAAFGADYKPALTDFENNGYFATHNVLFLGGKLIGYNNAARVNDKPLTTVKAEDAAIYFANGIPEKFFENKNLTEIELPENVKSIGDNAFSGSSLKLFGAAGISSLGKEAFKGCNNLEEITIRFAGTAAAMYAGVFMDCINLKKVTFEGNVQADAVGGKILYSLPTETFRGCTALEEVELGRFNNFKKANNQSAAFLGCASLKTFDFDAWEGEEIPAKTFSGSGLSYAIITNMKITTIGQEAFYGSVSYVKLGANITKIGAAAFKDCNDLIVEIPYDDGGVYSDEADVDETAFPNDAKFYISASLDGETPFIRGKDFVTMYPTVKFGITDNTEESVSANIGSMVEIVHKVFITAEDVVAPQISGYIFADWYYEADESRKVEFPIIIQDSLTDANGNLTLYAKYFNENKGSVDAHADVKYVYYIEEFPTVELDDNETVIWTLIIDGLEQPNPIASLPFIIGAAPNRKYSLKATISGGTRGSFTQIFDGTGINGYALTKYSDNNVASMTIPDTFDDGTNGAAPIIALFAGAFRQYVPVEFTVPASVRAIFKGYGESTQDFADFDHDATFGDSMKAISIPAATTYIADGVFTNETVQEIVFGDNSNLKYVTSKAFDGSAWWLSQIEKASENHGFIMAGRVALKFVGTGDVLLLEDDVTTYTTTKRFGLADSDKKNTVDVTLYYKDTVVSKRVEISATSPKEGVYMYTFTKELLDAGETEITVVLNTSDTSEWTYVSGTNTVLVENAQNGLVGFSLATGIDDEVTIPNGTNRLANGLFRDNKDLKTVILDMELVGIGDEAFLNSGLTTVRYGSANEQFSAVISEVGKNAFGNTPWYKNEKVILGTMFIKYNNMSGATAITLTENITSINAGAFKGATNLTSVTISSSTVREIGAFAFKASGIKSIVLPRLVSKVGRGAFMDCVSLTSANLSACAIVELPDEAFSGDRYLSTLSLPGSTTTLGVRSLFGCERLTDITAEGILGLAVTNESYDCGLDETAWYKVSNANEDGADIVLTLGNVLVKYVIGENAEKYFEENNEYTVTVPDGITMIAYGAFSDEKNSVTRVVLPNSVTTIGSEAFKDCGNLTSVSFGTGLKKIENYAFADIATLTTAELPAGLEEIGDYAFRNTGLKTEQTDEKGIRTGDQGYTIPDSVTSIGTGAFYGANNLTIIHLGSKIEYIGDRAFNLKGDIGSEGYGGELTEEDVKFYKVTWALDINPTLDENGNQGLSPIESLAATLYEKGIGANVFVTRNDYSIRFYTSDDAAEYIASEDMFRNGYAAWRDNGWLFYKESDYPTIDFDNDGYKGTSFKSEYILEGDIPTPGYISTTKTYTFMEWTIEGSGGKVLTYPYVVTKDIKLQAKFYANEVERGEQGTYKDVNDVTFTFGEGAISAFETPVGMDTLYIPNKIDGKAVTSVILSVPDTKIKTIVLTNGANFNGMTQNVFSQFTALEKIVVSGRSDYKVVPVTLTSSYDGVTYEYTFYAVYSNDVAASNAYGTKLFAVVGNVNAASEPARDAYKQKHSDATQDVLDSILLDFVFSVPEGVAEISKDAFVNTKISKIGLPSTLTKIGDNAFGKELETLRVARGIALTDVTFNAIPEDAPIMQKAAGSQEQTPDYVGVNGLRTEYKDPEAVGTIGYFYTIANVLTQFRTDYTNFTALNMPTTMNSIDITVLATQLNRNEGENGEKRTIEVSGAITLPTNIQRINAEAFAEINFHELTGAETYDKLRDIIGNVFDGTDYYSGNNEIYVGKILVKAETADDETEIRAGTIAIATRAFQGASNLTKLVIPDSVVSIGDEAFYGCNGLLEVTIPNSVVSIGKSAFAACTKLQKLNIDTVNSALSEIGDRAFLNDKALEKLSLPYNLKKVGASAFSGCQGLTAITFDGYNEEGGISASSLLEEIGDAAFTGDINLTGISIPDNVKVIEASTFEGCSSLESVNFSRNSKLKEIKDSAFAKCVKLGSKITTVDEDGNKINFPKLTTVKMPNNLVSVGASAFEECSGMWGIEFQANLASLGANVFKGCTNLAKISIYRATAPAIEATTFFGDGEQNSRTYKLRIYVRADANDLVKNAYILKWSDVFTDCADYIYDVNEVPVVRFTSVDTDGNLTGEEKFVEADCILNPVQSFSSGNTTTWYYYSAKDGSETINYVHLKDGKTIKVEDYGNQSLGTASNDYVLVVDYDEMTLVQAAIERAN